MPRSRNGGIHVGAACYAQMKHALLAAFLLTSILPLSAQSVAGATEKVVEIVTATSPMRTTEASEVFAVSAALVESSVALFADGTARSTHQLGTFHSRIELKGISFSEIVKTPLSEADKVKGVSRRYIARIKCTAHRIWDGPMVSWSEWRSGSYGFFPSAVIVEEIDGALRARANRIADFTPGIDESLASAN